MRIKESKILVFIPLLFSVQESKGLEYENIIIYNLISDNPSEFNLICEGVNEKDLLADDLFYSRGKTNLINPLMFTSSTSIPYMLQSHAPLRIFT